MLAKILLIVLLKIIILYLKNYSEIMIDDKILELGIDNKERLYIKPETERFVLVYRTATEVHWDNEGLFLYSPKPREWTYFEWYKHITEVVKNEFDCRLILTEQTVWGNIDIGLRKDIENW